VNKRERRERQELDAKAKPFGSVFEAGLLEFDQMWPIGLSNYDGVVYIARGYGRSFIVMGSDIHDISEAMPVDYNVAKFMRDHAIKDKDV